MLKVKTHYSIYRISIFRNKMTHYEAFFLNLRKMGMGKWHAGCIAWNLHVLPALAWDSSGFIKNMYGAVGNSPVSVLTKAQRLPTAEYVFNAEKELQRTNFIRCCTVYDCVYII